MSQAVESSQETGCARRRCIIPNRQQSNLRKASLTKFEMQFEIKAITCSNPEYTQTTFAPIPLLVYPPAAYPDVLARSQCRHASMSTGIQNVPLIVFQLQALRCLLKGHNHIGPLDAGHHRQRQPRMDGLDESITSPCAAAGLPDTSTKGGKSCVRLVFIPTNACAPILQNW